MKANLKKIKYTHMDDQMISKNFLKNKEELYANG